VTVAQLKFKSLDRRGADEADVNGEALPRLVGLVVHHSQRAATRDDDESQRR